MKNFIGLFFCLASCLTTTVYSQELITKAESDAEQARLSIGMLTSKALPIKGAPQIEVMEPDMKAELATPLQIRIKFITEGGASLIPSSLRVYYGTFGIDITERLMKKAKFEGDMLVLDRAEIPTGVHRLLLKIKDDTDRASEKLLTLNIVR
ncbi:MAG: hypothetical protein Q8Q55_00530 [Undibacterium sp.]|nr:hypothetical protein [Undibacterium sp.]